MLHEVLYQYLVAYNFPMLSFHLYFQPANICFLLAKYTNVTPIFYFAPSFANPIHVKANAKSL